MTNFTEPKRLTVIPISEDYLKAENNIVELTMFLGYTVEDNKIEILKPEKLPVGIEYSLNPIGILENFQLEQFKNIEHNALLQESVINTLTFENPFNQEEVNTMSFKYLYDKMLAYIVAFPEDKAYLSVLKVSFDLSTSDYYYKVFNVVSVENGYAKATLVYDEGEVKIHEESSNDEKKELHSVGTLLQFSSFQDDFSEKVKSLITMYLISNQYEQNK